MNPVLAAFAAQLSGEAWTEAAIERQLLLKLPRHYARYALPLTQHLKARFPKQAAPAPRHIARALAVLPQTRRVLDYAARHGLTPALPLTPVRFLPNPAFATCALPALSSPDELADWLLITPDQLVRFADLNGLSARTPNAFAPHYRQHLIPKKNGTLRLIEEPKPFLKVLQRSILARMLNHIPAHPAAYGFVSGRNCLQAAARHAGEAALIRFDIADFFPRVSFARLYGLFRTLGYPAAVAQNLAGLVSTLTPAAVLTTPNLSARALLKARHLPQGAPTSPALANLTAFSLDCRLSGLARSLQATYTRYADDLTFSGDRRILPILHQAVPAILADEGFTANPAKTNTALAHQRQQTTGIVVNLHLNLPRPAYDRLKATLHHLQRPDDPRRADKRFLARLGGQIDWLEQVNPAKAAKLRTHLDRITATDVAAPPQSR